MKRRRVLFVCMGNICRSPAGEAVCRAMVEQRGLSDQIEVDSAGTIGYHAGSPADQRMCAAAQARGYALNGRARKVTREDLRRFDLVVAMDSANYEDLVALHGGPSPHIRKLGSFLGCAAVDQVGDVSGGEDVPDPYYGGAAGFERVLDMIERACPVMIEYLLGMQGDGQRSSSDD